MWNSRVHGCVLCFLSRAERPRFLPTPNQLQVAQLHAAPPRHFKTSCWKPGQDAALAKLSEKQANTWEGLGLSFYTRESPVKMGGNRLCSGRVSLVVWFLFCLNFRLFCSQLSSRTLNWFTHASYTCTPASAHMQQPNTVCFALCCVARWAGVTLRAGHTENCFSFVKTDYNAWLQETSFKNNQPGQETGEIKQKGGIHALGCFYRLN